MASPALRLTVIINCTANTGNRVVPWTKLAKEKVPPSGFRSGYRGLPKTTDVPDFSHTKVGRTPPVASQPFTDAATRAVCACQSERQDGENMPIAPHHSFSSLTVLFKCRRAAKSTIERPFFAYRRQASSDSAPETD